MKILALDISTKTGWAVFDGEPGTKPTLLEYGLERVEAGDDHKPYPFGFWKRTDDCVLRIMNLVWRYNPDVIVIEETNSGRNRYTQKTLEFIHGGLLADINVAKRENHLVTCKVVYISSSIWRQNLGLALTKDEKKANAKLTKALKVARVKGERVDKAALGVKGKVTKKHIAVRHANAAYNLNLKQKDNDIADAVCLGLAFFGGAPICDGK